MSVYSSPATPSPWLCGAVAQPWRAKKESALFGAGRTAVSFLVRRQKQMKRNFRRRKEKNAA